MLVSALFVTNTGIQAASQFLDVVSNNIANSTTNGFKLSQPSFQSLLYTGFAPAAAGQGVTPPTSNQLGSGVVLDSTTALFTQGPLTPGTGPLDLAITGPGFFPVVLPDGSTGFTRAGNFTFDAAGNIVTPDGFLLAGGITVPPGTSSVSVSADGTVTAITPDGEQQIGTIALTQFPNPGGLARVGNTTFATTAAAGDPVTGVPGTNGLGTVSQGFLEQSNVDLGSELINLLIAQRTFAFNTQTLQVENAAIQATLDLIR